MKIEHIQLHHAQSFVKRNVADAQHVALPSKGYFYAVRNEQDEIIAIMGLQKIGAIMRIKTLLTRRSDRRKGYASALVDHALLTHSEDPFSIFCTTNSADLLRRRGFVDQGAPNKAGIVFMKRPKP